MTYPGTTDVIGSFVVFDPTGRDLPDCYEVGKVVAVKWNTDDDGDTTGRPRPVLHVMPNAWRHTDEPPMAVTRVAAVLKERER